jgi:hypothetical protein
LADANVGNFLVLPEDSLGARYDPGKRQHQAKGYGTYREVPKIPIVLQDNEGREEHECSDRQEAHKFVPSITRSAGVEVTSCDHGREQKKGCDSLSLAPEKIAQGEGSPAVSPVYQAENQGDAQERRTEGKGGHVDDVTNRGGDW